MKQVDIGTRLGGHKHKIDVLVSDPQVRILVSTKWQQAAGTAEQKVPFEVMCLAEAIRESGGGFQKAYLVLGGGGWTLRGFFTSQELWKYLNNCDGVSVVSLERFVALANQGKL